MSYEFTAPTKAEVDDAIIEFARLLDQPSFDLVCKQTSQTYDQLIAGRPVGPLLAALARLHERQTISLPEAANLIHKFWLTHTAWLEDYDPELHVLAEQFAAADEQQAEGVRPTADSIGVEVALDTLSNAIHDRLIAALKRVGAVGLAGELADADRMCDLDLRGAEEFRARWPGDIESDMRRRREQSAYGRSLAFPETAREAYDLDIAAGARRESWDLPVVRIAAKIERARYLPDTDADELLWNATERAEALLSKVSPDVTISPGIRPILSSDAVEQLADLIHARLPKLTECMEDSLARLEVADRGDVFAKSAEENAILLAKMQERLRTGDNEAIVNIPIAEFCDLSFVQVNALTSGDWTTGLLRVNRSIPAAELTTSKLLADVRTTLVYLRDTGPIAAETINEPAADQCEALLERFQLVTGTFDLTVLSIAPKESSHFWPIAALNLLRMGGFVDHESGYFTITPKGLGAIADDAVGQLFASLVLSLFRARAARHFDMVPLEDEGLLDTVQATIYLLGTHARSPRTIRFLLRKTWLRPRGDGKIWSEKYKPIQRELEAHVYFRRLLRPLMALGLVEMTEVNTGPQDPHPEFSLTPLFDQCFELHPLPPAMRVRSPLMPMH